MPELLTRSDLTGLSLALWSSGVARARNRVTTASANKCEQFYDTVIDAKSSPLDVSHVQAGAITDPVKSAAGLESGNYRERTIGRTWRGIGYGLRVSTTYRRSCSFAGRGRYRKRESRRTERGPAAYDLRQHLRRHLRRQASQRLRRHPSPTIARKTPIPICRAC